MNYVLCKRLKSYVILRKCNPAHFKREVDFNSQIENRKQILQAGYAVGILKINAIEVSFL